MENDKCMKLARDLINALEAGEADQAESILANLTKVNETSMYQDLGKLTRELHDTLNGFDIDSSAVDIAEHEIVNAKERLNYVIKMTEKAAHKTLQAAEEVTPICEELESKTIALSEKWASFIDREISLDDFKILSKEIGTFLEQAATDTTKIKTNLYEIMLAQDYQDLTGQTINKVINMVQNIEDNLISFIKKSSPRGESNTSAEKPRDIKAEGPQIAGIGIAEIAETQDDVDDLLSSLGF